MGCFRGSKYKTEAVSPEQEQMYKLMSSIMQGGVQQGYQSKPMWSTPANPGQMAGMDYIQRQLGYGGYQQPGFYTAQSQNIQMPTAQPPKQSVRANELRAPWLR